MEKPGDWRCSNCGDLQFASRLRCRKCTTPKPGKRSRDDDRACTLAQVFGLKDFLAACDRDDAAARDEDVGCLKDFVVSRDGADAWKAFVRAPQPGKTNGDFVSKPGDWRCCDEIQFASRTQCRRCGREKKNLVSSSSTSSSSSFVAKPGDWRCESCNEIQFASRPQCRRCGREKKKENLVSSSSSASSSSSSSSVPPPPLRKGDWVCTDCNTLQFARNRECRDCKKSKPVGDDSVEDPCVVCMERTKNASFLHEDEVHSGFCMECAEEIFKNGKSCPMCRKTIDKVLKTFA